MLSRHRCRSLALGLLTSALLGTAAALASAPLPLVGAPGNTMPMTEHDVDEVVLQHRRRTTVQAYREVGRRDPKWDAAAVKALEGYCNFAAFQHRVEASELMELGKAAVEVGCDDPMVLYCYGLGLRDTGAAADVSRHLEMAHVELRSTSALDPPEMRARGPR